MDILNAKSFLLKNEFPKNKTIRKGQCLNHEFFEVIIHRPICKVSLANHHSLVWMTQIEVQPDILHLKMQSIHFFFSDWSNSYSLYMILDYSVFRQIFWTLYPICYFRWIKTLFCNNMCVRFWFINFLHDKYLLQFKNPKVEFTKVNALIFYMIHVMIIQFRTTKFRRIFIARDLLNFWICTDVLFRTIFDIDFLSCTLQIAFE